MGCFLACLARQLQVLIVSDEHPNVVRCFAMEEDREFVYLALEKCRCTLSDWVNSAEGKVRGVPRAHAAGTLQVVVSVHPCSASACCAASLGGTSSP